jgi:hypothetical protein
MDDTSGAREFNTEPVDLAEIADALRDDDGVDTRRVRLAMHDDELVIGGYVASPEEADRALDIAEQSGLPVVNELQVDAALREGIEDPDLGEDDEEALDEDELLVGDPDLVRDRHEDADELTDTSDDENEPFDPPDEPIFPPTRDELDGGFSPVEPAPDIDNELDGGFSPVEPAPDIDADAEELDDDERPAAADLTAEDLRGAEEGGGGLPSLDPDLDATAEDRDARRGLRDAAGELDDTER